MRSATREADGRWGESEVWDAEAGVEAISGVAVECSGVGEGEGGRMVRTIRKGVPRIPWQRPYGTDPHGKCRCVGGEGSGGLSARPKTKGPNATEQSHRAGGWPGLGVEPVLGHDWATGWGTEDEIG